MDDEVRAARVAFIGLGRMGRPMAANVARAGLLASVHDLDVDVADSFGRNHDVRVAADPADAARDADVVITMLPDVSVTFDALTGPTGALSTLDPGSLVIDMGTAPPSRSRELAAVVGEAGSRFLDAPVSGSVRTAAEGRLTIMVGGDERTIAEARPVLDTMAADVHRLGGVGDACVMKLAVNGVVYAVSQAVAEALVLLERAGIDLDTAYDVLERGAAGAPMVAYRRSAFLAPESTPVSFTLDLATRDLGLLRALADEVGAPMPQVAVDHEVVDAAIAGGLGSEDMAAVLRHLRRITA